MLILYLLLGSYFIACIIEKIVKKRNNDFDIYIGIPGTGKTTFVAWLVKRALKHHRNVFCNVPIKGANKIERADIGRFLLNHGILAFDEAGSDYNNRKSTDKKRGMTDEEIKFYKYHRHFDMDCYFFSQGLDIDITLRRLAQNMYLLKKTTIPFMVKRKRIKVKIDIDKETHQLIESYSFDLLGTKYIFSPPLWKMFNSHSTYDLPTKKFEVFS